jgi:VIT1/CCC1 family predicted Fe2+/Mn2+ transporter
MKLLTFIGKDLLTVVLPFAFFVISTILVTALIACLGAIMGHNNFVSCFQGIFNTGIIMILMIFVTLFLILSWYNKDEL